MLAQLQHRHLIFLWIFFASVFLTSFSLLQNKTQVTFGGLTAPSVFKTGGFVSTKGDVLNSLRIYKPFLIFLESCPRRHQHKSLDGSTGNVSFFLLDLTRFYSVIQDFPPLLTTAFFHTHMSWKEHIQASAYVSPLENRVANTSPSLLGECFV